MHAELQEEISKCTKIASFEFVFFVFLAGLLILQCSTPYRQEATTKMEVMFRSSFIAW